MNASKYLLLLLCLCAARSGFADDASPPNIVFIFTDDQAPWALGASGHPHASTPHMDRLVREGAYLVNAFTTTPVCSPSRAGLMASRYGSELGITDWIRPGREDDLGLHPSWVTWPEILQAHGYATALIGKWHLGTPPPHHPTRTGFDHFMGFLTGGTKVKDPILEAAGEKTPFEGFTTDILTDAALDFLKEQSSAQPFLLCLHYRAPHAPWLPLPEEDWQPFAGLDPTIPNPDYPLLDIEKVKRVTREYLGSVAGVDRNVGRLLQALEDSGQAERTVVIFTSDHGYNMGHNGIWHKGNGHWILTDPPPATPNVPRGQRPNMYDNSLRVPTIVRWPGVVEPGSVIEETISNLDWYPTLLSIAGASPVPSTMQRGGDFSPLLKGEEIPWDNNFYAEYSTHHQSRTHMRAYRTPHWKLVRDFLNPERDELFHLADDPAETTNHLGSEDASVQKVTRMLHARILAHMRENGDPVLPLAEAADASGT